MIRESRWRPPSLALEGFPAESLEEEPVIAAGWLDACSQRSQDIDGPGPGLWLWEGVWNHSCEVSGPARRQGAPQRHVRIEHCLETKGWIWPQTNT